MSDFFDRLSGSGTLDAHTPDQGTGGTWTGTDANQITISGGAAYVSGAFPSDGNYPTLPWTPPGADYAVAFTLGADFVSGAGPTVGAMLRMSGAYGSQDGYLTQCGMTAANQLVVSGPSAFTHPSGYRVLGSNAPAVTVHAGDVLMIAVSGSATVTVAHYLNGVAIPSASYADSDLGRFTVQGSAGLRFVSGGSSGNPDVIRTIWAGATSGPAAITIAPPTPTVTVSTAQGFTLSTALTGETFDWTASAGSVSGNAASETWTAPSSGTTATVTGTSLDLPIRTATATVTLSGASATAFTLSGPSSGFVHNASANFTYTPTGGNLNGTITPGMTGLAGAWTPTVLSWTASATPKTATFTPSATGSGNANGTGSPSLTQPSNVSFTSLAQTLAVSPGTLPTGSTNTVTFTGGGTLWNSSAPTFTPTGVAGVSIGSITVNSNTSATAPVTTGSATGTVTWTDSTTSATATESVAAIGLILSIGEGFGTGLSTVGYAVYSADGSLYSAWTTSGVTERGTSSGDYGAVIAIPTSGQYEVRWSESNSATPPYVHDIVSAATLSPPPSVAAIAAAILNTPQYPIATSPTGCVDLNFAQAGLSPRALDTYDDAHLTVGDALVCAIAAAAGKQTITGLSYKTETPAGTIIRTFTLDSATAPTQRS